MPKIETLELRVCNTNQQREFYQHILGMHDLGSGRLGYGAQEAGIRFLSAQTPYAAKPNDVYWKIAIAVPNIELAYTQLTSKGITVGTPKQFQDIGYLAHFQDTEGFTIELIEHFFKGDRPKQALDQSLLGGGAHLNLITLRTADIKPIEKMVTHWGMKPLSVQPVENKGFTLYFYAFTRDTPPSDDLQALENRTWLYQRRYSVLEIQHVHCLDKTRLNNRDMAGYNGIQITTATERVQKNELLISSY